MLKTTLNRLIASPQCPASHLHARSPCRAVLCHSMSVAAAAAQGKARAKSTVFRFKHFDLSHGKCAQKMGTDSMLLGAWAQPPPDTRTVLDVGTGTGVLALMMAQKTHATRAMIHAIDIDQASHIQASENAAASPWPERLLVAHASFQEWAATSPTKYDMLITNPPYFLQSSKPGASDRAAARHADVLLPFSQLAEGASQLLQPTGRLCLILPAVEAQRFVAEAAQHGLLLTNLTKVFTKCQDPEPKRHIMQFELAASAASSRQQDSNGGSSVQQLVVMQRVLDEATGKAVHIYSEQYQQLTEEFHHPAARELLKRGS